ncbi:alkene reductase [Caldimonas brevitalea]|uniref:N-ethylmaleimide reductase n=1 Tax=Caldimonas brevitalea TaxID=413882 RepID=A0A0G3BBQ4_9BURK|nr:alkene reductase [Caldimonas brevitalea]AKJ26747.1 N-ethylmaleimide reductase [Caldimonas brevitalea]
MPTLFDPIRLGELQLANRLVMAPLTRNRAGAGQTVTPLTVEYYRQRANPSTGAGLIVTEASQVTPMGQGYIDTPGIHTPEQVAAWKRVTDAVHAEGGKIVIQLWHVGRISHVSLLPGGQAPVAPSAIAAKAKTFTRNGFEPVSTPRALALEELPGIVADYRRAARLALEAGFDGVEVHGANGYLLDQFLRDGSNHRTDAYGGSIENRARLLLEVVQAVTAEIGAGRTGLRLSPVTPSNDAYDSHPQPLFNHVVERLAAFKLMYLHIIEGQTGGARDLGDKGIRFDYEALRQRYDGPWMVNNGYDRQMALDAVASGRADLVAIGRPFISNPDLGRRLRDNVSLTPVDNATLYGGGAEGYTDYPTLENATA